MLDVSWTIEGEQQLARRLMGIQNNIKDYTKPFRQSADMLEKVFSRDVFSTQGGAIDEKWKRLSPYTVAQKARQGYPSTPLVGSGAMQRGFRSLVTSDQATIYNTQPYFRYHQSKEARSRLPRRVMMKLANNQKQDIVRIFQMFIRDAIK